MICVTVYDRNSEQSSMGDATLLSDSGRSATEWMWVDFSDIDLPQEANVFEKHFSFDPLAVADASHDTHPPKLEHFEDHFYLVLKGLDSETKTIHFSTIQVAFFVGEHLLITMRKKRSLSIDHIWEKCTKDKRILH